MAALHAAGDGVCDAHAGEKIREMNAAMMRTHPSTDAPARACVSTSALPPAPSLTMSAATTAAAALTDHAVR
jgi:enamine deaminase RidA (YjgF/YER057c/UK114 family)